MAAIKGTAINFAPTSGVGVSFTNIGTLIVQNYSRNAEAEMDQTRDASGDTVALAFYDVSATAQFEYIPKGTGLADAITQTKIPAKGDIGTITSSSDSGFAGTTWVVMGATLNGSNTGAVRVTVSLQKWAGITGAANA